MEVKWLCYGCSMKIFFQLLKDQSAATAVEYSLFAALISIATLAAMTMLGTRLDITFGAVLAGL